MEEIKLTQEQLDSLVAERLAEAKKGLFTEEELNKRVTSEVDRRVENGIQKGIETQKSKWEKEFSEKAKLTAEELAQKEIQDKLAEMTAKEREIQTKSNRLEALQLLADAEVPKSQYEKMLGMLVSDNIESTKANVTSFIEVYNATKTEVETKVKSELGHVKNPKQGQTLGVDKASFDKMGYADKLKFKVENPDLYKKFME